jgi:hypothetical protein
MLIVSFLGYMDMYIEGYISQCIEFNWIMNDSTAFASFL